MADTYQSSHYGAEIDRAVDDVVTLKTSKQDKLVSGTNIATINGKSLLNGGNIAIKEADAVDAVVHNENNVEFENTSGQTLFAIQSASSTQAGVMTASDKTTLNSAYQKASGAETSIQEINSSIDDISDALESTATAISKKQDKLTAGSNVSITNGVISAVDTTYALATTTADGLMSKEDRKKLSKIGGVEGADDNLSFLSIHVESINIAYPEDTKIGTTNAKTLDEYIQEKSGATSAIAALESKAITTDNLVEAGIDADYEDVSETVMRTASEAKVIAQGKQDKLTAGNNITIAGNTISAKDTTYSNASSSSAGLMSAADKQKLDGVNLSAYQLKIQSITHNEDSVDIDTDDSTGGFTIDAATSSQAGVMSKADKTKLDAVESTYQPKLTAGNNIKITNGTISATDTTYSVVAKKYNGLCPALPDEDATTKFLRQDGTWKSIPNASTGTAGLMSADEHNKLGTVATGANNYSLPTASASNLGGVKVGSKLKIDSGVLDVGNDCVTLDDFIEAGFNADYSDVSATVIATASEAKTIASGKQDRIDSVTHNESTIDFDDANGSTLFSIDSADASHAGLMSKSDKIALGNKQDKLTAGTNIIISGNTISAIDSTYDVVNKRHDGLCPILPNETSTTKFLRQDGAWSTIPNAATGAAGLMSADEHNKLNTIEANANNYALPTASDSTLGGIKVGTNLSISNGVLSATDTTYSLATSSADGLLSSTDYGKLSKLTVQNEALTTTDFNAETVTVPDDESIVIKTTTLADYVSGASVSHASSADSATTATQDGNGNVITSTYQTKLTAGSNISIANGTISADTMSTQALEEAFSAVTIDSIIPNDSSVDIDMSNGVASFTIDAATTSAAGVMSKADKVTLDNAVQTLSGKQDKLTAGTNITISGSTISAKDTTYSVVAKKANGLCPALPDEDATDKFLREDGTWNAIPNATTGKAGLMSASEHNKLNGIETGANAYSLPTASASTLGGVKVGTNLSISNGVLSATDTTYSLATASADGLLAKGDYSKLAKMTIQGNSLAVTSINAETITIPDDDGIIIRSTTLGDYCLTVNDFIEAGLNADYADVSATVIATASEAKAMVANKQNKIESITHNDDTVDIDVDDSTGGFTIDGATTSHAGVMTKADKLKLNELRVALDLTTLFTGASGVALSAQEFWKHTLFCSHNGGYHSVNFCNYSGSTYILFFDKISFTSAKVTRYYVICSFTNNVLTVTTATASMTL